MKKGTFFIDGGYGEYIGYCTARTWNGWLCPWFNKSEVDRIIELEKFDGVRFKWNGIYLQQWNEGEEYPVFVPFVETNGERVYQLGDGFCWDTDEIIETI